MRMNRNLPPLGQHKRHLGGLDRVIIRKLEVEAVFLALVERVVGEHFDVHLPFREIFGAVEVDAFGKGGVQLREFLSALDGLEREGRG